MKRVLSEKTRINLSAFLIVGLSLFFSFNAAGQRPNGIDWLEAKGSFTCWGEPQEIELWWSIYEADPIECHIHFSEKVSCYFSVQPDYYKLFKEIASKFGEWNNVAHQNNVTKKKKKIPVDLSGLSVYELKDDNKNREFSELPCLGAYFKVEDGKTFCQITFRATRESLSSGIMSEEYFNYGMQFNSPREVEILAECLDYEWLNKIKWGDEDSVNKNNRRKNDPSAGGDTNQLFK